MGFFDRLRNWFSQTGPKVWNKVKEVASNVFNPISQVSKTIGDVSSTVDRVLRQAKDLPIVGEAAATVLDNSLYKEVQKDVGHAVKLVDDVGKVGKFVGNVIDQGIQGKKIDLTIPKGAESENLPPVKSAVMPKS